MRSLLEILSEGSLELHSSNPSTMHEPHLRVFVGGIIPEREVQGIDQRFLRVKLEVQWKEILHNAEAFRKLIDSGVDPAKLDELAEVARALRTLKKVLV